MRKLTGLLLAGLVVLGTIWLYNRFSGKSITTLGAKT